MNSGGVTGRAARNGRTATAAADALPRILGGAVNGVELVGVGALRLARDVVVTAVSGAANIGAEALAATTAGARGIVSAASRMVGDIAGTAQSTLRSVVDGARRPGDARRLLLRAAPDGRDDGSTPSAAEARSAPRTRTRSKRQRAGSRTAAARAAA